MMSMSLKLRQNASTATRTSFGPGGGTTMRSCCITSVGAPGAFTTHAFASTPRAVAVVMPRACSVARRARTSGGSARSQRLHRREPGRTDRRVHPGDRADDDSGGERGGNRRQGNGGSAILDVRVDGGAPDPERNAYQRAGARQEPWFGEELG